LQTADQHAKRAHGVNIAAPIILVATTRLRLGPARLGVRNILIERVIPWTDVVGVSFPEGSRWARVDLADDEYTAVLAIQAIDGDRAVESMDTLRTQLAKYRPDLIGS
jgi:hypothetical protein